ncbi:MAG: TRAP transporter substrate-binding protein [Candidatus Latescibacterota bacterium]|jgi:TRAP-type C4-dicarboxylate transport system substrate-binding protein
MRGFKVIVACTLVALALVVTAWPTPAAAQPKPVELTYSIFFPPTHQNTVLATEWAREVEKRTEGKVKITVFPSGTLTAADKCYDGVEKGISDLGMSVLGYTRGRFPLSEVIDLPLGYRSGAQATALVNAFYQKFQPKEFDTVHLLYLHAHGPGFLHTKKPVSTLAEVQGLKIRCTGLATKIVGALGGTPVAMPMGETYDALSRGVVDGSMAPVESLQGWKWGEVVTSTTASYGAAYSTAFFVAMNKARWEALPAEVQQVFTQVSQEWIAKTGAGWDQMDQAGRTFAAARGNQLIALPAEEDARWAAAVEPIFDGYVKAMAEKSLPGAEALAFCREFLKQQ